MRNLYKMLDRVKLFDYTSKHEYAATICIDFIQIYSSTSIYSSYIVGWEAKTTVHDSLLDSLGTEYSP